MSASQRSIVTRLAAWDLDNGIIVINVGHPCTKTLCGCGAKYISSLRGVVIDLDLECSAEEATNLATQMKATIDQDGLSSLAVVQLMCFRLSRM